MQGQSQKLILILTVANIFSDYTDVYKLTVECDVITPPLGSDVINAGHPAAVGPAGRLERQYHVIARPQFSDVICQALPQRNDT